MSSVVCDVVLPGLRASERTVAVRDIRGKRHALRVEADFLNNAEGKSYLPIGVVYRDLVKQLVLIEFPYEPDSGDNRAWVRSVDLLETSGTPV